MGRSWKTRRRGRSGKTEGGEARRWWWWRTQQQQQPHGGCETPGTARTVTLVVVMAVGVLVMVVVELVVVLLEVLVGVMAMVESVLLATKAFTAAVVMGVVEAVSRKMSLTIQQIILDAKRLASRLKEHDSAADNLISQAQSTFNQVDAMKQYKEEVAELNEAAGQKPHSVLVASIQQENRHLRELQQENRELRAALEEHQNAMELIMSKYRQQVAQLIESSKVQANNVHSSNYSRVICDQADKICEMAAVMEKAAEMDEKRALEEQELMSRLTTENKGLRDLLEISGKYGSIRHSLLGIEAEDKEIQTELNEPLS